MHGAMNYDAILLVSFGGPEKPDDVIPFLENVLRGKPVPRERMLEVAEHYYEFGGVSPINAHNRALIKALEDELAAFGPALPVYWGNRNWHPMLADTLRQMRADGVKRALAFFTSAFSSYSGCRQYRENIAAAQQEVGEGAPQVDKLRAYFNHPGFIETMAQNVSLALAELPQDSRATAQVLFTAHSIPLGMAAGCAYEAQLREACKLVAEAMGHEHWSLVYQSRSGAPSQPWLEPDVCDHLRQLSTPGDAKAVVLAPIGFISDHMEILFDLDTEAKQVCKDLGLVMTRAKTAGTHPRFVTMIRELLEERTSGSKDRITLGVLGANPDVCPVDCCASGRPAGGRPGASRPT